jgi:transcriptional regulator with XRE-family HTH domain
MPRKKCDAIDRTIGRNIRFYRMRRLISQKMLAAEIDVTYQQVQKYENGVSAIAASQLLRISRRLGVPLDDLFEGVESLRSAP